MDIVMIYKNIKYKKCTYKDHKGDKRLPATPDYFYRSKKGKDGLRSYCQKCDVSRLKDTRGKAEWEWKKFKLKFGKGEKK